MRKFIVLALTAFMINPVITAQDNENAQKKIYKHEVKEVKAGNDKGVPDESSLHGKNVSALAQCSEPGKMKGDVVSDEARMQVKARRLMAHQHASPGNHYGYMKAGARGYSLQHRNMRMYRGPAAIPVHK